MPRVVDVNTVHSGILLHLCENIGGWMQNSFTALFPRFSPSLPHYRIKLRPYTYPTNYPTKADIVKVMLVKAIA